jgi:hypothetical protein
MTHEELHRKVGLALVRRGRSLEQVSEMAHDVLWRVFCRWNKAQSEAHWDVFWRLVKREGNLVIFKGGRPKTEQEIRAMTEKRERVLFRRFLSARDRRVLKKTGLTLDAVADFLQTGQNLELK